jgi:hypothetical protein
MLENAGKHFWVDVWQTIKYLLLTFGFCFLVVAALAFVAYLFDRHPGAFLLLTFVMIWFLAWKVANGK